MVFVDNIAGILVLRFLLGFFGSPCLATAGASYGDFYGATQMPYVITLQAGGATLGPVYSAPFQSGIFLLTLLCIRLWPHLLLDSRLKKRAGAGVHGKHSGCLLL